MEKISLIIDKDNCMGCHACEIACKQEHNLGKGPRFIRIIEKSPDFIPIYCHHCENPPCKEVCSVEAISISEQGIVLIDNDLCIGCKECIKACNYEAMQFDDIQEIAIKCDLCIKRLEKEKNPSCMIVCPTGCINLDKIPFQ
ncbi:MAG: 4Fe-4S dicluster domain-containing protein [Promethearchaeota archaeon]